MNKANPNQLFLGTYRLYRTDNAKAPSAGDVHWKTISGDLTSGCTGTAPNGAADCTISAIGVGGGDARLHRLARRLRLRQPGRAGQRQPDLDAASTRATLPKRPVSQIAVDREQLPDRVRRLHRLQRGDAEPPGHVFRTTDGGEKWTDISGNLPDIPVNSIDPRPVVPEHAVCGHGRRRRS